MPFSLNPFRSAVKTEQQAPAQALGSPPQALAAPIQALGSPPQALAAPIQAPIAVPQGSADVPSPMEAVPQVPPPPFASSAVCDLTDDGFMYELLNLDHNAVAQKRVAEDNRRNRRRELEDRTAKGICALKVGRMFQVSNPPRWIQIAKCINTTGTNYGVACGREVRVDQMGGCPDFCKACTRSPDKFNFLKDEQNMLSNGPMTEYSWATPKRPYNKRQHEDDCDDGQPSAKRSRIQSPPSDFLDDDEPPSY